MGGWLFFALLVEGVIFRPFIWGVSFLLAFHVFFPFLDLILVLVVISDFGEDDLDDIWEGLKHFGYTFDLTEDVLAFLFLIWFLIAQDAEKFLTQMEVDHPFQMFPHLLKFIAFASPSFFFEAFHFIVIFLEKFLDDVFVFIEEVFLLSHLHVFLERLVFNHFIEIVDF